VRERQSSNSEATAGNQRARRTPDARRWGKASTKVPPISRRVIHRPLFRGRRGVHGRAPICSVRFSRSAFVSRPSRRSPSCTSKGRRMAHLVETPSDRCGGSKWGAKRGNFAKSEKRKRKPLKSMRLPCSHYAPSQAIEWIRPVHTQRHPRCCSWARDPPILSLASRRRTGRPPCSRSVVVDPGTPATD
jgi:hypothetical protein